MKINRALLSLLISSTIFVASDNAVAKSKKTPRQIVKGVISQLSTTLVTVKEKTITLTARTRYEDFNGGIIGLSAFRVGDCVKIQVNSSAGISIAREMELEDSCRFSTVSNSSKNKSNRFDDSRDEDSIDDDSNDDDSKCENGDDSKNHRCGDDSRRGGSNSGKGSKKRDDK